jgi:uncharacterized protein (DUF433 family)
VAGDFGATFRGIEINSAISGGEARVAGARIPVWLLVRARQLGASEAELLRAYPTLRTEDLANAWGYYQAHLDEIEQQIKANELA